MPRRRGQDPWDRVSTPFEQALSTVLGMRIFSELFRDNSVSGRPVVRILHDEDGGYPVAAARGWAQVFPDGVIEVNRQMPGDTGVWVWALTHCVLHLGFGHVDGRRRLDRPYTAACCLAVSRYQEALGLGTAPFDVSDLPATPEAVLAARWRVSGVPAEFADLGAGGAIPDLGTTAVAPEVDPKWGDRFSIGIAAEASDAVRSALDQADKLRFERGAAPDPNTHWERARRWFVSSYPLLAALASRFTIVADRDLARRLQISVAAVDADRAEIYVNPLAGLANGEQWRFVLAHEMLHAALRHGDRAGTRDAYLWNVACDYVINGWLIEMGVGAPPDGLLHDPALKGLSAEAVYDLIARDLRRLRRLATLRGRGLGDILTEPAGRAGDPVALDDFYRRALTLGLSNHESQHRGLLPAGLVDEIAVLSQPPLPWDAKLARWFEEFVPAVEKRRSYARPSRRQSSTPDIPRPGWYRPEERDRQVTFGVVLDTSGSMSAELVGKALGAIASYALARDVPAARVVFCDAVAYDAGYVPVETIAGRVRVRGRGGTVLQPAVTLLETVDDFPADGPILIITDGYIESTLRVRHEHAYLVPAGARLPFTPRGPVFEVR
jgi:predicted metal-dependent peptidase